MRMSHQLLVVVLDPRLKKSTKCITVGDHDPGGGKLYNLVLVVRFIVSISSSVSLFWFPYIQCFNDEHDK